MTIAIAATVQYTSLTLWRFCMKHPEVRDVCDVGRVLFGGSQLAYNLTAVMFILNNTFIQGLPSYYLVSVTSLILDRPPSSSPSLLSWCGALKHSVWFSTMHDRIQWYCGFDMFLLQPPADTQPTWWARDFQCCDYGDCSASCDNIFGCARSSIWVHR